MGHDRCGSRPAPRRAGGAAPARVRFVLGEPGACPAEVLAAAWAPGALRTPPDAEEVTFAVPRFTLRTKVLVTDRLPALGVRLATDPVAADLSGPSPVRLHISQVVREAVLKIAEEGVEAAAVTVAAMRASASAAPRVTHHLAFDRPFGVVVLGGTSDVPLLAAWQAGPRYED